MTQVQHRPHRRGDNIPTVEEYSHWNEDAERVWYEENRYDMEHADEEFDDEVEAADYDEPEEDIYEEFDTEEESEYFFEKMREDAHSLSRTQRGDRWIVHGHSVEMYNNWKNCTGDSRTCPVVHEDDPEGLCFNER